MDEAGLRKLVGCCDLFDSLARKSESRDFGLVAEAFVLSAVSFLLTVKCCIA